MISWIRFKIINEFVPTLKCLEFWDSKASMVFIGRWASICWPVFMAKDSLKAVIRASLALGVCSPLGATRLALDSLRVYHNHLLTNVRNGWGTGEWWIKTMNRHPSPPFPTFSTRSDHLESWLYLSTLCRLWPLPFESVGSEPAQNSSAAEGPFHRDFSDAGHLGRSCIAFAASGCDCLTSVMDEKWSKRAGFWWDVSSSRNAVGSNAKKNGEPLDIKQRIE